LSFNIPKNITPNNNNLNFINLDTRLKAMEKYTFSTSAHPATNSQLDIVLRKYYTHGKKKLGICHFKIEVNREFGIGMLNK